MKIISDNPELLDKIYNDLKIKHINVAKEVTIKKGAMDSSGATISLIVDYTEHLLAVMAAIGYISEHHKKSMKVETKDGTFIPYLEYEAMTPEEKNSDIFKS